MHVVMVDNGRTKSLADPKMREMLYCIRCGACLNTCPVYRKIGGHAYGWVYSGPIGALVTPEFVGHRPSSGIALRLLPVRSLPGSLPGENQYSRPPPALAQRGSGTCAQTLGVAAFGAAHVPVVGLGNAPPVRCMRWAAGSLAGGKSCWRARAGFGKFRRTLPPNGPRSVTSPRWRRRPFAIGGRSFRCQVSGKDETRKSKFEPRQHCTEFPLPNSEPLL